MKQNAAACGKLNKMAEITDVSLVEPTGHNLSQTDHVEDVITAAEFRVRPHHSPCVYIQILGSDEQIYLR